VEAAANRDSTVSVRDLHVTRGGVEILRGIDLEIRPGTIYGLLGPSGAGKTTLMRAIMGLQRHEGELQVLERPAGSKPVRGRVGYMAQTGAVYSDLSVIENLRFFGRVFGASTERAHEVMAAMRLERFEHRQVWHLSGGEQRRVSLGCAIVGDPELMVLDEPTVGLDPALRVEFWETFGRWADRGQTLIVSSHVMDEAERCDRLVLMRNGAVLAEGTPAELLERTGTRRMEDAFLTLEGESAQ
jgi:ABC-2 type transport system ATP-binding protein